ncbi:hypothetical protein GOV10_02085, partial [Candidatus Woesearchaeota archaeon]|nr:hypothetical protein [Candidatus Woesearchaeota archaeon]
DMYSFNHSREEMQQFYELSKKAYLNVYKRLGLTAYINEASGGDFTKEFSHEFTVLTKAGEDTIVYCENCDFAQNVEISDIKPGDDCPKKCSGKVKESKAVEVGNIFDLGTKFTEDFETFFTDKEGKQHSVYMGSYGIGTSRLMGTIVEAHNDDNGIIWPETAAPYDVHLISLGKEGEETYTETEQIYNELIEGGIEVLWDDRDIRPGAKFADSDLIGIPWRIVVSPKTLEQKKVEIKKRSEKDVELISKKKLLGFLK